MAHPPRPPHPGHGLHRPAEAASAADLLLVGRALQFFAQHFQRPIAMPDVARWLGISETELERCFLRARGMTPQQALQQHRLNRLFQTITQNPRQGLRCSVHACGLSDTSGVVPLFERTFGIAMPQFLRTCRRAEEDRTFRLRHPHRRALVLPPPLRE